MVRPSAACFFSAWEDHVRPIFVGLAICPFRAFSTFLLQPCFVAVLWCYSYWETSWSVVFSHVMFSTKEGDRFNIHLSNEKPGVYRVIILPSYIGIIS